MSSGRLFAWALPVLASLERAGRGLSQLEGSNSVAGSPLAEFRADV